MKKKITKEVSVCDKCGAECDYATECVNCGMELCYKCSDKHGVDYAHAVYYTGSGDGFYCNPCDVNLTKSRKDERHNAYTVIKSLKLELDAWGSDFKKRQEAAEQKVKSFIK